MNQIAIMESMLEVLGKQVDDLKKYKSFFETCSCLYAEGVEYMTRAEIYEAIKREVKRLEQQ
jgi:hypothetical protein